MDDLNLLSEYIISEYYGFIRNSVETHGERVQNRSPLGVP
jgi:hypothetical protein